MDCLKPFQPGDTTGNPDGTLGADGNLAACVAAADRAVVAGERAMAAAAAAAAAEGDAEALARLAGESDSDGGARRTLSIICPVAGQETCTCTPRSSHDPKLQGQKQSPSSLRAMVRTRGNLTAAHQCCAFGWFIL